MRRLEFTAVHQLAGVADLIEPLRHGFVQSAHVPPRGHYDLGEPSAARTLLVMPSWREGGPIGVKIATVFPDNPIAVCLPYMASSCP
jgi:ornithine cyclodeaminase/alanine dehydrogenase-like protein (mu-crystallin family)